jgi:hypothetical protein
VVVVAAAVAGAALGAGLGGCDWSAIYCEAGYGGGLEGRFQSSAAVFPGGGMHFFLSRRGPDGVTL